MIPRIFFDVAWKIYETAHKWKREKDFPLVIYISTPYIFDSQGASNPFMEKAGSKGPEKKVTKHRTIEPPPPGTNIASPHIKPVTESTIALFPNDFGGDVYCK